MACHVTFSLGKTVKWPAQMVANASSQGGKQLYHYLASFPGGLGMRLTNILQLVGIVFSIESSVFTANQSLDYSKLVYGERQTFLQAAVLSVFSL